MLRENCGVVGAFSLDQHNVIPIIIDCLRSLQHRGQEAWGIAIPNKETIQTTRSGFEICRSF
jgi:amidophosphoribosyltransferase